MAKDYTSTLNLPQTSFSMRANLPQREPETLKYWEEMDLYNAMLEKNKDKPPFILHDGPPFSNGYIHMGISGATITCNGVNDMLKNTMEGYKAYLVALQQPAAPIVEPAPAPAEEAQATEEE